MDNKFIILQPSILYYSIFYLLVVCSYNLQSFNTITTSSNWFLHPSDGGSCIFGQLMAVVTCSVLLFCHISSYNMNRDMLRFISLGWIVIPYMMNNEWLSIQCFPLCLLWLRTTLL